MVIDRRCGKCSSCPSTRPAPCYRKDEIGTDVAIVLESPSALEQAKQTLLTGDAGSLAVKVLEAYGLKAEDCYLTSALNCRPNDKKEAMLKKAMLACRERLVNELKDVGVSKVLCLGPMGLSQLLGAERVLPITKARGRWERAHGMDVLGTFNPAWFFGEADYYRDFCADLEKFCLGAPLESPNVEMWYPQTVKETWEAFGEIQGASYVACDVETDGFSEFTSNLLAVGLGVMYEGSTDGLSVVLRQDILEAQDTWEEIQGWLKSDQASVFHNAKFDLKFLGKGLHQNGLQYLPNNVQDTMLLHYCLDERPMGRFQSHSLKNLARVRCDAPDYDINMDKWIKEYISVKTTNERRTQMRSTMHEYLALDCYYTAYLYPQLLEEVVEEGVGLLNHYNSLLMPGTLALVEVETHGAYVDKKFFEKQSIELQRRSAPILERIREETDKSDFNPNSPKQVADYLYEEQGLPVLRTARRGKLQEGKTSKQILKMLRKQHPEYTNVLTDILEYRNLTKSAGTYVDGLLKRIDTDNRIRSDFLPHGTSTGRLSARNPNLQNIPESSHTGVEIRKGYTAPPGMLVLNADYSQLELRVAAWLSEDTNFTKAYVEDRDFHQEVVLALYGTTKEETSPYMRYLAKCCTFGVLYGRGAQSLALGPEMDFAEEEFGAKRWSVEEAQNFFDKFFSTFSEFKQWTKDISAFAHEHHYVDTPFGNKRRFPLILRNDNGATSRQAVNTPIQGTAALLTFSAFVRIHHRFKELNEARGKGIAYLTMTVHDSIMGEFDPNHLDEVRGIVLEEMEENIPFETDVPFKADFEYAPSWGEVKNWNSAEHLPALLEESKEELSSD